MDGFNEITRLTPLAVLFIQGLFAWVLWTLRKAFVRGDEYLHHIEREQRHRQEQTARATALENRFLALEQRVSQLPDANAIQGLSSAVESLRGDIKAMDMRITGLDRLMTRLETALDKAEAGYGKCAIVASRMP